MNIGELKEQIKDIPDDVEFRVVTEISKGGLVKVQPVAEVLQDQRATGLKSIVAFPNFTGPMEGLWTGRELVRV